VQPAPVMTDSLVVNLSNSKENLSDDAFDRFLKSQDDHQNRFSHNRCGCTENLISRLDEKIAEMFPDELFDFAATNWKPVAADTRLSNHQKQHGIDQKFATNALGTSSKDGDTSSNDAGSELSADEVQDKKNDEKFLNSGTPVVSMRKLRGRRRIGSLKVNLCFFHHHSLYMQLYYEFKCVFS